jgi:hypothetical protein
MLDRGARGVHDRAVRTPGDGQPSGCLGREFVHVCVDDATRLAYAEVLADDGAASCIDFLVRALRFYRSHGIAFEQLMTDGRAAYASAAYAAACRVLQLVHTRYGPEAPLAPAKCERFVQAVLNEWVSSGDTYRTSAERKVELSVWLDHYNHVRPQAALRDEPPAARLRELHRRAGPES